MVTKLNILTKDEDFIGDVNSDIETIDIDVFDNEIVLRHLKGQGLDFDRGDLRIEIEKEEAIKMARSILFCFNAL